MFLAINDIIEYDDGTKERILWIDSENIKTFCILLTDEKIVPIYRKLNDILDELKEGSVKKIEDDTYRILIRDEDLSKKDIERRDERWNIISKLVDKENVPAIFYDARRGPLVKAITEEYGVSRKSVYKYLRKYWMYGQTKNSLIPNYSSSGGRGKNKKLGESKVGRPRKQIDIVGEGINITEDIKKIFNLSIKKYYNTQKKISLSLTYNLMLEDYFTEISINDKGMKVAKLKQDIPTIDQFRYWHRKNRNIEVESISRKGNKKYNLEDRGVLGDSTQESFGPGALYQVDATIADVYLISRYNPEWIIGRPVIYVLIDVYSRMITGIYVGLESQSWTAAMMALANCAMDKVEFCKEYGIDITEDDWDTKHLPQAILADRGEFEGINVETLINAFGIDIKNTPPYRADWKGIVERQFGIIHGKVKPFTPGSIEKDFRERGGEDYRLKAKLNIKEFTKVIIECVIEHNNTHNLKNYIREPQMIEDNVEYIPKKIWNWGIKNKTGLLRTFDMDLIRLNLMPVGTARVTDKGIRFKNMFYTCTTAIKEFWFQKARSNGRWSIEVSYDSRNVEYIYIKDIGGKKFEKCSLLSRETRYLNKTFDEVNYLIEVESRLLMKNEHQKIEGQITRNVRVKDVVNNAEQKDNMVEKCLYSESKSEKIKGIREKREYEKNINRNEEVFNLDEDSSFINNKEENEYKEQFYNYIYQSSEEEFEEELFDEDELNEELEQFRTIQKEAFNGK